MVSFQKKCIFAFMQTPFSFGRTVRHAHFTDREADARRLRSNFTNQVNTILISPRRWGKSSLVEKVASQVKDTKTVVVILDLFPIRNEEEFYNQYATAVIRATSGKLEGWLEAAKKYLRQISPKFTIGADPLQEFEIALEWNTVQKNYRDLLNLPERIAREKKINIVICLDEFQNITSFADPLLFQKRLRSEWQQHKQVTYCLYGSKQHMMMSLFEKQSMPFYKFGEMIYLPKIDEKYWIKYIVSGFARTKKQISDDLAAAIAQTVKCHPYYVQQLAHLTWVNTEKKAGEPELRKATDDLVNQNALLYFRDAEDLSHTQLNFLKAVASGAGSLSSKETIGRFHLGTSANVNKIKEALLKREMIDMHAGKVEFIDPAFELWFRRNMLKGMR